jgi:acid-sensing ion channel, other
MCSVNLRRNCYFEDERKLKFFHIYTKFNCIQECLANATLEICKCARFLDVRKCESRVETLEILLSVICAGKENVTICHEWYEADCPLRVHSTMNEESSKSFERCDCLASCNSIDYNTNVHLEKFKAENDSEMVKASMSVYFADDEFVVLRRYASFGTVTLLSNVGGLLGLFLGVSVLSVVEVFYFFVIRMVNNVWWKDPVEFRV